MNCCSLGIHRKNTPVSLSETRALYHRGSPTVAVIHTLVSPGFRQLDCDWRFDLFLWVHDEKDDFSPICNDRFPSAIYLCIYSFGGGAGEKSQVGVQRFCLCQSAFLDCPGPEAFRKI